MKSVKQDYDCIDFQYQEDAQAVLDSILGNLPSSTEDPTWSLHTRSVLLLGAGAWTLLGWVGTSGREWGGTAVGWAGTSGQEWERTAANWQLAERLLPVHRRPLAQRSRE